MDRNKKPLRRPPNPDMSLCVGTKKDNSKTKARLNETMVFPATFVGPRDVVGGGSGCRRKALLKNSTTETSHVTMGPPASSSKTIAFEFRELKIEFSYNDYLQAIMKQAIVKRQITTNKTVLDGQIGYYTELLNEKEQILKDIKEDTEMMDQQRNIVEAVKILETKIDQMKSLYMGQQISTHLENIQRALEKECGKLWLKNVKPIETFEEYDRFVNVIEKLQSTLDKIICGEIDFEGKLKNVFSICSAWITIADLYNNIKKIM